MTCQPIYPNQYIKVNTIFEVARQHGLRTAWSDKHPAYQMLSGPSGTGVQDFFTPEINSQAIGYPAGQDLTSDNAATMQYDSYKVQAILNEIDGLTHSRASHVAQGLPRRRGASSTAIIISAKHGQSPTDPGDLARVPDGPIIAAINAAWTAAHPGAGNLIIFSTDDDGMLLWLSDRSQAAADFVKGYLLSHTAAGNNISGSPITVPA